LKLPIILVLSGWSHLAPALAFGLSRTRTRPGAFIALGALVNLLSIVAGRVLADATGNNQLLSYLSSPLTAACFLFALAEWQTTGRERRWFRAGIFAFLVLWVLLVATVEDMRNFDLVTGPFYSLTLLAAGTWTLVRRAAVVEAAPLHQNDWFWVSLGLAVNGACTALSSPLGAILIARGRFDLFNVAWQIRGLLVLLSMSFLSWGIYRGPLRSKYATDEG
jgi:hypothetical protein